MKLIVKLAAKVGIWATIINLILGLVKGGEEDAEDEVTIA